MRKLSKKIISWAVLFCMVLALVPVLTVPVAAITTDTTLTNGQTLSVGNLGTAGENITITVPAGATVTVTGTQTILGTVTFTGGGTFIRGAGFTTGSMFVVGSGATLNLSTSMVSPTNGVTIDGNSIVATAAGGGVRITGGTLNMYENSHLTKHILAATGISTSLGPSGAGVYVEQTGTFNMYGGLISNNEARTSAGGQGGGGVAIHGAAAPGTIFNMTGGVIAHNRTNSNGGAVFLHGTDGVSSTDYINATMSGGTMTGNYANRWGGAMEVLGNVRFEMSGGRIIGNSVGTGVGGGNQNGGGGVELATNYGGIYANKGFYLSGDAEFTGNFIANGTLAGRQSNIHVYNHTKRITLTGNFTGSAGLHLSNNTNTATESTFNTNNAVGNAFAIHGGFTGAENFFLDNVAGTAVSRVGVDSGANIVWAAGTALTTPTFASGGTAPVVATPVVLALTNGLDKATYQWYRTTDTNTNTPANWTAIPEANAFSYTPTAADVGSLLICVLDGTGGLTGQQRIITGAAVIAGGGITPVPYIDAAGATQNCATYTLYTGQTALTADWYVVDGTQTPASRITVTGDVNIILKDGSHLNAADGGINVADGNSLTIYAQSGGTGALTATGYDGNAGIGGGYNSDGGDITITGGTITATGGTDDIVGRLPASIGGGADGEGMWSSPKCFSGSVTISGGTVNVDTSGKGGYGIATKDISISAGTVNIVVESVYLSEFNLPYGTWRGLPGMSAENITISGTALLDINSLSDCGIDAENITS